MKTIRKMRAGTPIQNLNVFENGNNYADDKNYEDVEGETNQIVEEGEGDKDEDWDEQAGQENYDNMHAEDASELNSEQEYVNLRNNEDKIDPEIKSVANEASQFSFAGTPLSSSEPIGLLYVVFLKLGKIWRELKK
uniref:Uncharacterized protein n=1 Tax=Nelumbo nucifera TaxID=4432 RepID=A0A822XDG3_NELNU|nr:TPA_asm: hypothetical protein HUJ06_019833 [Nelumbo nucifera]